MEPVLDVPIMNASGVHCTLLEELRELSESDCDAMVTKSITLTPYEGHQEPRLFISEAYTINSMGLPNPGVRYYAEHATELNTLTKPVTASVAALHPQDYVPTLIEILPHFNRFEMNLSCPNVEKGGIFAYDLDFLSETLKRLRSQTDKPLGVKLPAYIERYQIAQVAQIVRETKMDFLTLVNTFGLSCAIDVEAERMIIKPNGGVGGLGGAALRPIALAQVALFYQELKDEVSIIGVGGISSGTDVYAFVLAGASAVQIGAALWTEGLDIFTRIKNELRSIMRDKGIKKLSDKIGIVGQIE